MPSVRLYIIRHGETNENKTGIIQGHLDTQLNEAGIAQAAVVARAMEEKPFTEAWTSDLKRAVDTAEAIVAKHPGVELVRTPKLRERGLGALQGKHLKARNALLSTFPGGVDPSAEAHEAMEKRLFEWWDTEVLGLCAKPLPSNSAVDRHHVLVVSHGGFIGSLVKKTLETGRVISKRETPMKGSDFTVLNTATTTIDIDENGKAELVKYADISHMLEAVKAGKIVAKNVDVLIENTVV